MADVLELQTLDEVFSGGTERERGVVGLRVIDGVRAGRGVAVLGI